MKKFLIGVFVFVLLAGVVSVVFFVRFVELRENHHSHNMSLQIKENSRRLQINARYNPSREFEVQRYLDTKLKTDIFRNSHLDATVTLEDDMTVYVKNSPGRLVIRLNRDDNSEDAYWKLKDLVDGLKENLQDK